MTEDEKWEQYIVDCINNRLFDGWVHERVRCIPHVQEAGQKWSRDLLILVTQLSKSYPSNKSGGQEP